MFNCSGASRRQRHFRPCKSRGHLLKTMTQVGPLLLVFSDDLVFEDDLILHLSFFKIRDN